MSEFTLRFDIGNAAFDGADLGPEVARILRDIAARCEDGPPTCGTIHDINGNRVGKFNCDRED